METQGDVWENMKCCGNTRLATNPLPFLIYQPRAKREGNFERRSREARASASDVRQGKFWKVEHEPIGYEVSMTR